MATSEDPKASSAVAAGVNGYQTSAVAENGNEASGARSVALTPEQREEIKQRTILNNE